MSHPFNLGKSEKIEPGSSLLIPHKERTRLIVELFYLRKISRLKLMSCAGYVIWGIAIHSACKSLLVRYERHASVGPAAKEMKKW